MTDVQEVLAQLNPQQKEAVTHLDGAAMVLAGAGSGKTKVLTTRVAWLIKEQQLDPHQIMLVTFTNKAAAEMNRRVEELTGYRLPYSGTFHSLSAKILRKYGHIIGLSPGFTIYDSDDQLSVVKSIYKELGISTKEFNPRAIKGSISTAKNEMLTAEEYEKLASGRYQTLVARVYKAYERELKKQQAVDFDDLLLLLVELFKQSKETLGYFQETITHVLVDEYQDTNKVQYQLTKYFTLPQNNVFVVGDFSQSIYTWRGADYRNMLALKTDFPHISEYRLEQNYRSTQTILDAATNIIKNNTSHPILELWTDNTGRDFITVMEAQSGDEEARLVLEKITQDHRDANLSDIVILYRTNAQSRPFEEACIRFGIPYRLVGGFKFYERKEIKDLLAYLRLCINPHDQVSRERILKIGKRRATAFDDWLHAKDTPDPLTTVPAQLLDRIIEVTNYYDQFDKHDPEDIGRIETVKELLNVASQFSTAAQFLENIALIQDDSLVDVAKDDEHNKLTLMSLHSAKGLEFPIVFMVGMEEGLLPHSRSLMEKDQMEEERRLCYVGITRAKQKLYLSFAKKRWVYGTSSYAVRSRFLNDIPQELVQFETKPHDTYDQGFENGSFDSYGHYRPRTQNILAKKAASPSSTKRRLVLDDDMLDQVLRGEISVDQLIA